MDKEQLLDILKRWREALNCRVQMKVDNEYDKKWFLKLLHDNREAISLLEKEKDEEDLME